MSEGNSFIWVEIAKACLPRQVSSKFNRVDYDLDLENQDSRL
jgi:hypothetical protein